MKKKESCGNVVTWGQLFGLFFILFGGVGAVFITSQVGVGAVFITSQVNENTSLFGFLACFIALSLGACTAFLGFLFFLNDDYFF